VGFAADERAATTLAMLAECFEVLGGVPGTVLADRMGCLKGGVVANVVVPTAEYVRFAGHYGFRPDFCEAADPQSKGIVENLVGYAKSDLMVPCAPFTGLGCPIRSICTRRRPDLPISAHGCSAYPCGYPHDYWRLRASVHSCAAAPRRLDDVTALRLAPVSRGAGSGVGSSRLRSGLAARTAGRSSLRGFRALSTASRPCAEGDRQGLPLGRWRL
jgi:hypothetical protein